MNIKQTKRPWIKSRSTSRNDGFYQSNYWKSIRHSFRHSFTIVDGKQVSNLLCLECFKKGIIKEGCNTDHIISKKNGGTEDFLNLQTLCDSCHAIKSAEEGNAK